MFFDGVMFIAFLLSGVGWGVAESYYLSILTPWVFIFSLAWLTRCWLSKPIGDFELKLSLLSNEFYKWIPIAIVFGVALLLGIGVGVDAASSGADTSANWGAIGSILAGIGTVGLLWLALTKADEWIKSVKAAKRLDLAVGEVRSLRANIRELSRLLHSGLKRERILKIVEENSILTAVRHLQQVEDSISESAGKVYANINILSAIYKGKDETVEGKLRELEKLFGRVGEFSVLMWELELDKDCNRLEELETVAEKCREAGTSLSTCMRDEIIPLIVDELH